MIFLILTEGKWENISSFKVHHSSLLILYTAWHTCPPTWLLFPLLQRTKQIIFDLHQKLKTVKLKPNIVVFYMFEKTKCILKALEWWYVALWEPFWTKSYTKFWKRWQSLDSLIHLTTACIAQQKVVLCVCHLNFHHLPVNTRSTRRYIGIENTHSVIQRSFEIYNISNNKLNWSVEPKARRGDHLQCCQKSAKILKNDFL